MRLPTDGVVEGIEDPRRRFCLGVQWHPEFEINDADRHIFRAFVAAAGELMPALPETRVPALPTRRRQRAAAANGWQRCWRAPGCVPAARPSAGLPKGGFRSMARCRRARRLTSAAETDIRVDGKPIPQPERARLWRYHKPAGLVTTHRDERGPADGIRRAAKGFAAADFGRASRSQFRRAVAIDQ